MKVKALKSFTGAISMYAGEVRDIRTQIILDDLTAAGYIEPVTPRRSAKDEGKRDSTLGHLPADTDGRGIPDGGGQAVPGNPPSGSHGLCEGIYRP